jgi:hypothetical protein
MLYLDLNPAIANVGSNAQKRRMVFFGWREKEFFRTNVEEHFLVSISNHFLSQRVLLKVNNCFKQRKRF